MPLNGSTRPTQTATCRGINENADLGELRAALASYRTGRVAFLAALGCSVSNRDPLAEFSERLVAALLDGELAPSRVQKGFDLVTAAGEKVQVRYLANPADRWVNEHLVKFDADLDRYALVLFEALDLKTVIVFPRHTIGQVCAALGKRHPRQDDELQFTRQNYWNLMRNREQFEGLGVHVFEF